MKLSQEAKLTVELTRLASHVQRELGSILSDALSLDFQSSRRNTLQLGPNLPDF